MSNKPPIDPKTIQIEDYDNFVGKRAELPKKASLVEVLDIEDTEDNEKAKLWKAAGMMAFDNPKNAPYKKIIVNFRTKEDYEEFSKMIGQNLSEKTKTIWHPKLDRTKNSLLRWIEVDDDQS
jgi:hypothetical protein